MYMLSFKRIKPKININEKKTLNIYVFFNTFDKLFETMIEYNTYIIFNIIYRLPINVRIITLLDFYRIIDERHDDANYEPPTANIIIYLTILPTYFYKLIIIIWLSSLVWVMRLFLIVRKIYMHIILSFYRAETSRSRAAGDVVVPSYIYNSRRVCGGGGRK